MHLHSGCIWKEIQGGEGEQLVPSNGLPVAPTRHCYGTFHLKGLPQVTDPLVLQCSCPCGGLWSSTYRNQARNEGQPQWEAWCTKQCHKHCGTVTKAGLKIVKASLKSAFQDCSSCSKASLCVRPPMSVMQNATVVCSSTLHVPCRIPMGILTRQNPAYLRRSGKILIIRRLEMI